VIPYWILAIFFVAATVSCLAIGLVSKTVLEGWMTKEKATKVAFVLVVVSAGLLLPFAFLSPVGPSFFAGGALGVLALWWVLFKRGTQHG
jgi:hypothetical protein